ncbi:Uncharacterised protein [Klebsiella michiganensis]|uniref:Uncharacterized protein n=1 Tax=Klebsiella michiganensis TaxID=1134687 RepID=A0A7H4MSL8_9ENTR|nr:Uncharacterised protein [Klebsiella michiganensis]STV83523.1 Uncharacterised protein [Klebsiella michiganensis]
MTPGLSIVNGKICCVTLRTLGIGGLGLVNHKLNHHKSPSFLGRENKLSVVIQTELITNGYHFTVG